MMFSTPCGEYKPSQASIDALDKLLILHADHEQNASTSTVKIAGSSGKILLHVLLLELHHYGVLPMVEQMNLLLEC